MTGVKRNSRGFTLIELLVVIAIIGVLASVVMAALDTARNSVQAANVAATFRQIEKALTLVTYDLALDHFVTEVDLGCSGLCNNPTLPTLVADTDLLGKYFPRNAIPPNGDFYFFDSDPGDMGAPALSCGVNAYRSRGANIYLHGASCNVELRTRLDEIFDDGDGNNCGKVSWHPDGTIDCAFGSIVYKITVDQQSF